MSAITHYTYDDDKHHKVRAVYKSVHSYRGVSFVPSCAQGTVIDSATVVMFVPTIIVASVSDTIIEYQSHETTFGHCHPIYLCLIIQPMERR